MADLSGIFRTEFLGLLLTGFFFLFSFVASHPLYFLYLIFLFPYILKILSFLAPLFLTTSLLLTAFLSISPDLIKDSFSAESSANLKKVSALLTAYRAVLDKLQPSVDNEDDEDLPSFEALEVYKIVFDASMMIDEKGNQVDYSEEDPEEKILQAVESSILKISHHADEAASLDEVNSADDGQQESIKSVIQEKRFEDLLKETDGVEFLDCCDVEEKRVETAGSEVNKAAAAVFDKQKAESLVAVNGSEAKALDNKISDVGTVKVGTDTDSTRQNTPKKKPHSRRRSTKINFDDDYTDNFKEERASKENDLGRFGSSRKDKEWSRTLACKLYEEKHRTNVVNDSSEGMDLLWEAYEAESTDKGNARTDMLKRNERSRTKIGYFKDDDHQEDDEEEEEEEIDAQLCCLQAFKFSAGKMNLGVGKRNFARFTKAVKGLGWLHRMSKTGGKKKVHDDNNNNNNNGDDTFRFA